MKKYKTGGLGKPPIEEVEAIRETPSFIVYMDKWNREVRAAKHSQYENYFDSWEEAHAFLMEKAEAKVDLYRQGLESAKGRLGQIKRLKQADKP